MPGNCIRGKQIRIFIKYKLHCIINTYTPVEEAFRVRSGFFRRAGLVTCYCNA